MRVVLLLLTLLSGLSVAAAQERVEIAIDDGRPLQGILFRPQGPGPFPAIVALHGCGGLGSNAAALNTRHADWAARLVEKGFMVLFPDSYSSRGLGPQCLVKDRTVRPGKERVVDAQAAKTWLQERTDVMHDRISLLGWSNGGSSVLWSIASDKKGRDLKPDFYKAIAFYPGCRLIAEAAQRRAWQNRIPMMILIGEADTWTPADQCRQLVWAANTGDTKDGGKATIISYPGAVHEFDHPDRKPTRRTGLAFTGDDSGEAMVGTEPEAREDALRQVPDFLTR
jgi:dienelactone hydrolase